jgi:sterol desaturase/sphingolipid hydroxylase (fatty acid hydroxylase superfamily)
VSERRALRAFANGILIAAGTYVFLKLVRPFGFGPWQAYVLLQDHVAGPLQRRFEASLLAPAFYAALALTLALESLIPADPRQKLLSASFVQDLVWFGYETVLQTAVIVTYVEGLRWAYRTHFSFLTIDAVGAWPYWVRFAAGTLLLDFLYWLQHYVNHKVPWFWKFHALHHSQTEINFFTDFRYHVVEYVVRHTILVIPFLIFEIRTPTVVLFAILTSWYTRFYHGNVRTNLGLLRYALVTPQSHRLHHSALPQHRDLNFGSLFSVWDRLFRTQHPSSDEYPVTGLGDAAFPHEQGARPLTLARLTLPLKQLAYPVVSLARGR